MELNTDFRPDVGALRRIKPTDWIILAVTLVFVAFLRWQTLGIPFERDEGEYAVGAQLWLQGILPYEGINSLKLPGIFLSYVAILAVFGETCRGVHQGLLVVNLLTVASLFLLARTLLDRWGAHVAALCYGLTSLSPSVLGFTANAEHFALLPAVTGLWLLLRAGARPGRGALFVSGMLLGFAPMIKQQAGVFALLAGALVIIGMIRGGPGGVPRLLIFVAGGLTTPVVTGAYFAAHGAFPQLWHWTIEYGAEYSFRSGANLGRAGAKFIRVATPIVTGAAVFWIVALMGGVLSVGRPRLPRHRGFIAAFIAAGFLATCPGLHFRPHYFLFLLPAAALAAGFGLDGIIQRLSPNRALRASVAAVAAVVGGAHFLHTHATYLRSSPERVLMTAYGARDGAMFAQISKLGDYLNRHSLPTDTLGVIGSDPELLFYARRRSAIGNPYMYPLFERQKFAATMRRQMMDQMEAAPPRFLVWINNAYAADYYDPRGIREVATWLAAFRAKHYAFRTKMHFYPDRVKETAENGSSGGRYAIVLERIR